MLNRNDLAKQFELVVKQEIKNYQDSLNNVLQSIRELKAEIEYVRQESLENHAAIHSVQVEVDSEMNNLRYIVCEISRKLESFIHEQDIINFRNNTNINDVTHAASNLLKKIQNIESLTSNVDSKLYSIQKINSDQVNNLNNQADHLVHRFQDAINRIREDFKDYPKDAHLVKTQLEEQIHAHKVDVAGIMKELMIYKKQQTVNEKQIENIYTLIERLKP